MRVLLKGEQRAYMRREAQLVSYLKKDFAPLGCCHSFARFVWRWKNIFPYDLPKAIARY